LPNHQQKETDNHIKTAEHTNTKIKKKRKVHIHKSKELCKKNYSLNDKSAGSSKSNTGLKHDKNSNMHSASPTASDGRAESIGTGFGKS